MDHHADKKNIVIVGAGFAGITAALSLDAQLKKSPEKDSFQIILIDRHHHQLYTPALYEIASIPREYARDMPLISSLLLTLSQIVQKTDIVLLCDEFIDMDTENKKIMLKEKGDLPYSTLVLALGAETNYFDIPGLEQWCIPLKTADDAVRLRNAIENTLKEKGDLKIVIAGAGASGVELAAEFVNYVCMLKEKILPSKKICNETILLIEASPEILPGFDAHIAELAKKRLQKLGVHIKTGTRITEVEEHSIIFKTGEKESYDILIWTGGVKGPTTLATLGLSLSPKGSLLTDEYLRVKNTYLCYAIGDNTAFTDPRTGKLLPWVVPVAEAEARHTAKNIMREISGKPLRPFRPLKRYPFVLAIGKKYAIADLIFFQCWGALGWIAKIFIELRYLLFLLPAKTAFRIWQRHVQLYRTND
ncbi:MAG: NADH dehydrogenase [Parcubacteria group bacterium Gr01-1014_33]|nr:MAG: NADH dehydrogenase [Parcubacteria group bacterium Gr01-1014_33]